MKLTVLKDIMLACVLIMTTSSCAADTTDNSGKTMSVEQYRQLGWQVGKVTFQSLEGGFYGIVTEKGEKLLPMNLPNELKVANSLIVFKGNFDRDMMTIQQWGTPFKITEIQLIKKGVPDNAY